MVALTGSGGPEIRKHVGSGRNINDLAGFLFFRNNRSKKSIRRAEMAG